jgi:hypothetical protein
MVEINKCKKSRRLGAVAIETGFQWTDFEETLFRYISNGSQNKFGSRMTAYKF